MSTVRFAAAGLVPLLALALAVYLLGGGNETLAHATLLPEPRPVGRVELVDMRGDTLNTGELEGKWRLLFFGFANCPDICPITLQQLATARRRLAGDDVSPLPDILFVSVDPARDSPDVLSEYAARFGDGVTAATGEPAALREFAGSIGAFFQAETDETDTYDVSHTSAVFLLNPDGELHALFSAPQDVDALVNDLPILTGAR